MHTDLDTLATALYVRIDDTLKATPELRRWRPTVGIAPKLSDAELLTVAVMQALLGYVSEARDAQTEATLAARGVQLLRPAFANEPPRPGGRLLRSVRQLIESVNDTLKGQLDLERHGGRSIEGVTVRVLQRLLALTAAIWHNHATGQPVMRSLIAYDHYA